MLTDSDLWLSNFKPLDKLWPVLSPVTCPDKPWFQVPSCTPWQTPTNPEFCHMSLSHVTVTCPCHTPLSHPPITPLGLPDISGSQNSSSPNPKSQTQPPNKLQPNLTKLQLNLRPNFGLNFGIRLDQTLTLFSIWV